MNNSTTSWLKTFPFLTLAFACGSGASDNPLPIPKDDPGRASEIGAVCPECGPRGGGDTTDFGTLDLQCEYQRKRITAEEAEELDFAVGYGFETRSLDAPLRWEAADDDRVSADGYKGGDRVLGEVSFGDITHLTIDEDACVEAHGSSCDPDCEPDYLEIEVATELAVNNDVLSVSAQGYGLALRGRSDFIGEARMDIADAEGTLRVGLVPEQALRGVIDVAIHLDETGLQGTIAPILWGESSSSFGDTAIIGQWLRE